MATEARFPLHAKNNSTSGGSNPAAIGSFPASAATGEQQSVLISWAATINYIISFSLSERPHCIGGRFRRLQVSVGKGDGASLS